MLLLICAAILNVGTLCAYSKRPLHILQLNNYRAGESAACAWRERQRFIPEIAVSIGGAAAFLLFCLLLPDRTFEFYFIGLIPYFTGAILLTLKTLLFRAKKPLAFTARLKRLYIIQCALVIIIHAVLIIPILLNSQFSILNYFNPLFFSKYSGLGSAPRKR